MDSSFVHLSDDSKSPVLAHAPNVQLRERTPEENKPGDKAWMEENGQASEWYEEIDKMKQMQQNDQEESSSTTASESDFQ